MIDCSEKLRQLRLSKHLTQGQLAQGRQDPAG